LGDGTGIALDINESTILACNQGTLLSKPLSYFSPVFDDGLYTVTGSSGTATNLRLDVVINDIPLIVNSHYKVKVSLPLTHPDSDLFFPIFDSATVQSGSAVLLVNPFGSLVGVPGVQGPASASGGQVPSVANGQVNNVTIVELIVSSIAPSGPDTGTVTVRLVNLRKWSVGADAFVNWADGDQIPYVVCVESVAPCTSSASGSFT
jgi:hypothetical protein